MQRASDFPESPVSRIFGGVLCGVLRREGATATASAAPFTWLPLDIDSEDVHNVSDALLASLHGEHVEGTDARRRSELQQLPRVLLLHLKRFTYDPRAGVRKLSKRVAFTRQLTLPSSVAPGAPADRQYELIGAVHHHGSDAESGHYTVDVRRPEGAWVQAMTTRCGRWRTRQRVALWYRVSAGVHAAARLAQYAPQHARAGRTAAQTAAATRPATGSDPTATATTHTRAVTASVCGLKSGSGTAFSRRVLLVSGGRVARSPRSSAENANHGR